MFIKTIILLSFIASSSSSIAALPSTNLRVNGSVNTPSCNITSSSEQTTALTYTFQIPSNLFTKEESLFNLEPITKEVKISCNALTYLSFVTTDDREQTELNENNYNYGLGTHQVDKVATKIGFYTLTVEKAKVKYSNIDNDAFVNANLIENTTRTSSPSLNIKKASSISFATPLSRNSTLISAQEFSAQFTVKPTINGTLKNKDGINQLDGLAVVTFSFGL